MLALCSVASSLAVLKEKDLPRTLGVLKAELKDNYERQQMFMSMYEQRGARQHQMLVSYMQQCEQISLMLYSQSAENTFDMAYACQQATNLSQDLKRRNSRMHQYDKIIVQLRQEIERYDALIQSLKSMPPVSARDADSVVSVYDSILMQAIDSLAEKADSIKAVRDTIKGKPEAVGQTRGKGPKESREDTGHPLYLRGQELLDREECLKYAESIKANLQRFLDSMENENTYYQSVTAKVAEIDSFAQERYKVLQSDIFKNGSENYFEVLAHLPMYVLRAQMAVRQKYKPFAGHDRTFSEWRGATVLFISVFLVLYLCLALLVSYAALRWLLPKRWRGHDFKLRLRMLNNVVGIALFAVVVMVVHASTNHNFVAMGTGLVINMAWLMEVIFLSLYIRLHGEEMRHAAIIYMPLMLTAFIVILMRIVLIPNMLVNLVLPPLMLALCVWQLVVTKRHRSHLPVLDMVYIHLTTIAMVVCTVASWSGYTLLAVQILVWWTFQLAAIMTITCLYDLMGMYERKVLVKRLAAGRSGGVGADALSEQERESILQAMRRGDFIGQTWFYDLMRRTFLPIMGVASVLLSFYWAAQIFEMTSLCEKIFLTDFVKQSNLIRLSLYRLCLVAALWFVFRFLNYGICGLYTHTRRTLIATGQTLNVTLARNVIAILCWGAYLLITLAVLEVPKSGISIVGAGLATGLGFAMQSILENFFYGINLMAGRVHVGDYIECDGILGKVESITYQSTQIVTADGSVIAFLNSALFSKNFKNMTRNHRYELVKIPVGVAYGSNVQQVRQMLVQAITPLCGQTDAEGHSVARTDVPVNVVFANFGDSSVDLLVCIWMRVEDKIALTAKVRETIYNTLTQGGVEIPFPQCDVHMRK